MFGPSPAGSFDPHGAVNSSDRHDFLEAGRRYRVTRGFKDYTGCVHPVGETWSFVGSSFVPYDDGLTL
jgi:hypothetical protein